MTAEPLVAFLLAQPTATEALLATHIDDKRGRCRGCTSGTGRVGPPWPCVLHTAATTAHQMREQGHAGR